MMDWHHLLEAADSVLPNNGIWTPWPELDVALAVRLVNDALSALPQ
jgi:hypothetical protein